MQDVFSYHREYSLLSVTVDYNRSAPRWFGSWFWYFFFFFISFLELISTQSCLWKVGMLEACEFPHYQLSLQKSTNVLNSHYHFLWVLSPINATFVISAPAFCSFQENLYTELFLSVRLRLCLNIYICGTVFNLSSERDWRLQITWMLLQTLSLVFSVLKWIDLLSQ